jgi:hypothetical protein
VSHFFSVLAVLDTLNRNVMHDSMLVRLAPGHDAVGRDKRIEYLIGDIKVYSLIFCFRHTPDKLLHRKYPAKKVLITFGNNWRSVGHAFDSSQL